MKILFSIYISLIFISCKNNDAPTKSHSSRIKFIKEFKDPSNLYTKKEYKIWLDSFKTVYYQDQFYRDNSNPKYYEKNLSKQNVFDSINQKIVFNFIDSFGYPSVQEIGFINYRAINITLDHSKSALKIKYLPLVEQAFNSKKMTPTKYAIYKDKLSYHQKKFQTYGTQLLKFENKYTLYPVDLTTLNFNRNKIGIKQTVADYLKMSFKIEFDSTQYQKDLPRLMKHLSFTN